MTAVTYFQMTVDRPVRGLYSKKRRQREKSMRTLKRLWRERK